MKATLQRVGNSRGVIIPKAILAQVGFEREVEIDVEADAIVIRKPKLSVREGWAEASRAVAAAGDDRLVWPQFANEADGDLTW
jgi:antitoxin MazE